MDAWFLRWTILQSTLFFESIIVIIPKASTEGTIVSRRHGFLINTECGKREASVALQLAGTMLSVL